MPKIDSEKEDFPDRNLARVVLIIGSIWSQIILVITTLREPTPENLTLFFSIEASGLYTLLLFLTRKKWLLWGKKNPQRTAFFLGVANAAVVETIFWAFERALGASGVAASENLLLDLVLTMPWYIGIVWSFTRGFARTRFRPETVLLLGALYEVGGDGIVGGQALPLIFGEPVNLLESWVLLPLIAFWHFIPVYSSIVLPPTWLMRDMPPTERPSRPLWDALSPLLWIFPFTVYLVLLMLLLAH